jgi:DNA gyrase subunit A
VFIEHRKDVITRRTVFELRKAQERLHILEGLKIALDNLDAVIALIRAASDPADARAGLIRRSSTCASSASPTWSATRSSRSTPRR